MERKRRKQKTTNVRPLSLSLSLQVNIAAVVASVVGAFFFAAAPIKAVQMLWVNLIMDSLASLALASEAHVVTVVITAVITVVITVMIRMDSLASLASLASEARARARPRAHLP